MPPAVLRTPDDRFANLPGWPYAPHYVDGLPGFDAMRMHYVDEGPRSGAPTFFCLHGEPTWAYLYRRMIPAFVAAGVRVIAPDFFGFGRSDKPAEDATYSFGFHRRSLIAFIEKLNLTDICLVCQDWGGLLGLTMPMAMPDRFTRLLAMNTGIGIGKPLGEGFDGWRDYVAKTPDLMPGKLLKRTCPHLSDAEAAAYDAPFPDISYKGGVRRFPQLVQTSPEMEGVEIGTRALEYLSQTWSGESFMAIGMTDPVLGEPAMRWLRSNIRGCPEPMEIAEAGHFVQEWGEPIARAALKRFGIG